MRAPKKPQLESESIGPSNSRPLRLSPTKSIAKRSGMRTVPSIESVAPRWALIGSQQPLPD